jgi:atrazine chlorohydrolase/5-methylthioadenosine/S-adenosylhomocysteine deaminase/melamine deaminase
MQAHGLTVGIGTDDANCNDAVNMIAEMKTLCLIHRAVNRDPSVITPEKALEMATIDGARAIGLESEIGSIEVGKRADITLLDCRVPQMTPHPDIAASIVFQANGSEVRDVMVDGSWRVRDRMPTFLSATELRSLLVDASKRAADIAKRAGIATTRSWRRVGI